MDHRERPVLASSHGRTRDPAAVRRLGPRIGNTLALSVFERTRELGLLRAGGMSRRQTRRVVRWEAAIMPARRAARLDVLDAIATA